jgi:hypothetical protein
LKKIKQKLYHVPQKGGFMDVDKYLWQSRSTLKKAAEDLDMSMNAICKIKLKKGSPSLLNAIKLIHMSQGEITNLELLSEVDKKEYEKWLCKQNSSGVESIK